MQYVHGGHCAGGIWAEEAWCWDVKEKCWGMSYSRFGCDGSDVYIFRRSDAGLGVLRGVLCVIVWEVLLLATLRAWLLTFRLTRLQEIRFLRTVIPELLADDKENFPHVD